MTKLDVESEPWDDVTQINQRREQDSSFPPVALPHEPRLPSFEDRAFPAPSESPLPNPVAQTARENPHGSPILPPFSLPNVAPPPSVLPQGVVQPQKRTRRRVAALASVAGLLVLCGLAVSGLLVRRASTRDDRLKSAIVRVTTPSGSGTGFFVNGPDELAYVATAYHVIERGEPILIERNVETDKKPTFVEAYPETEVVAFDADADVAIVRIKNVAGNRFDHLELAAEPVKDAKIDSYGFPASSLAKRAGLVSKDGKILSLVKFPVVDRHYGRVLRDNATDGLLVSTDIEPGFSGGPTCNEAGEVVGINVTKDREHVGQNGAVSVQVLKQVVRNIKPAKEHSDPKPEELAVLLGKIQSEYLMLSLEDRTKVRETDYLSSSDMPALRVLVNEVRRQERNTDTTFVPKLKLSGQAALGIFFARLPGKQLESYLAPATRTQVAECELANQRLVSFLEGVAAAEKQGQRAPQPTVDCDDLAFRPLAWDLTAATLQWSGKERDISVTKVERVDDGGFSYRASVKLSGVSNLVELWFGVDQGKLRLKLFDDTNSLYAIDSPRNVPSLAFAGTWVVKSPRVADASDPDMDVVAEETLSVSVQEDGKALVRHVVTQRYLIPEGKHGSLFRCNQKSSIETGLVQSFSGTLENGVIIGLPQKDAERTGADSASCVPKYQPDRIVLIKLVGDQMDMVRTSGSSYPEMKMFAKQ